MHRTVHHILTMGFILLFLLFTITVTLIIIFFPQNQGEKLPPSPWKLPFIGNLHQMLGGLPHHALCRLSRRYGPIMYLKLGQVDHIIVSNSEMAREILKTHDINFSSRPVLVAPKIVFYDYQDIAFSPYGDHWRQLRKICVLELLSTRRVKSFRLIREVENMALVRSLSSTATTPINLTQKLFILSNTIIAQATFGSECKHAPRFISEVKKVLKLMTGFEIADLFPSLGFLGRLLGTSRKLERIRSNIDEILDEIIAEHEAERSTKEGKEEDLLDVLLKLNKDSEHEYTLTMTHVKAVILDMFTAGTVTTATGLNWVMAELMRNPAVMKKAKGEVRKVANGRSTVEEPDVEKLHYMRLVIKESLRMHTRILSPRVCGESCNVGGYKIRKGARVMINAWAIGRDPRYWEDAEIFKPERFDGSPVDFVGDNFHYLPFGAGRRVCPGVGFGLANMHLTLAKLLFHFEWQLPNGMQPEDLDMTEAFGVVSPTKSDLRLIAVPWIPYPDVSPK